MDKPKKSRRNKSQGAPGMQTPHAIFPKELPCLTHGLYREYRLDMRTRPGKAYKTIFGALLERFPTPAPAIAQVIAQRCAVKLIRAISFEVFVLSGNTPAPNADRDYLALTGSIRADIKALHELAKDGGPIDKHLDLDKYLALPEAVRKAMAAERVAVPVKADPSPKPEPEPVKRTLF